ncbi:MAG: S-adenosylmethionine:tRNA ribosyltransferase-isomerase [Trueperaceae bacterium]
MALPLIGAPAEVRGAGVIPEERGLRRDEVRLLISDRHGHQHARFFELPRFLERGDVLVVNRSGTLPAALPAHAGETPFQLNLSTHYGRNLWLAEPRWSAARPGPIPLTEGALTKVGGIEAAILGAFPGIPRLRFFEFGGDWQAALSLHGKPIRYGYLAREAPLSAYQTIFADRPGSAEMPSAARPFTARTLDALENRGVELVRLTLHTGVSSLESSDFERNRLYPEPFEVEPSAAHSLNAAVARGSRIIAVGTTMVRALASVWDGPQFRAARGLTTLYVQPGRQLPPLAGLLTGFHEPQATHLAMLEAVAGRDLLADGYREARTSGYLWHEFGDVHLLLPAAN